VNFNSNTRSLSLNEQRLKAGNHWKQGKKKKERRKERKKKEEKKEERRRTKKKKERRRRREEKKREEERRTRGRERREERRRMRKSRKISSPARHPTSTSVISKFGHLSAHFRPSHVHSSPIRKEEEERRKRKRRRKEKEEKKNDQVVKSAVEIKKSQIEHPSFFSFLSLVTTWASLITT